MPLYPPPSLDLDASGESSGIVDKFVPGLCTRRGIGSSASGSGFTVVENTSDISAQEGSQIKAQMELFDIISNNTEIDHPLCDECCDTLINLLSTELRAAEEESVEYEEFLKRLENEPENDDVEALEEQLREVMREIVDHCWP